MFWWTTVRMQQINRNGHNVPVGAWATGGDMKYCKINFGGLQTSGLYFGGATFR